MSAADGAQGSAVDGTGDGYGAGHLKGDFRDGELGGENQLVDILQAEAEFGVGEGPAAESAFGTDIVDEVVVDVRVIHGDEGEHAKRVGAEVEGALRRGGIHTGLPPAGEGQERAYNQRQ